MFNWFTRRRRRKLLETPLPERWSEYLDAVVYVQSLTHEESNRLRDSVRIFVAEKDWEGCRGLELTEEMQVTIAAMACLMVLGLDDFYFDNVQTILVYPGAYVAREQRSLGGDFHLEGKSQRYGEAHYRGPIILSWAEVELDARDPGHGSNLVIHEFAHQLDMLNGEADGVPLLPSNLVGRWQRLMLREYERLQRNAERRIRTLVDPYGANSPAEFFAVVSEAFFDVPGDLEIEHPELYALLREFYRQDPARRTSEERTK